MIQHDFHMHSDISTDSDAPMEAMIEGAIKKGLDCICFTEHMDYDFPECYYPDTYQFDPDMYVKKLLTLKEAYQDKIEVCLGVEAGTRPYLAPRYEALVSSYPFDFVLCSTHLVYGLDPYFKEVWEGHATFEVIRDTFADILNNIKAHDCFDSYAHLDYVVRYCPDGNGPLNINDYREIIDEILISLIKKGKALEINTAGYKYGLLRPHPQKEILMRYRELGGTLITIGSDAHKPEHIAYSFDETAEFLRSLGFREYAVYKKRTPSFYPL